MKVCKCPICGTSFIGNESKKYCCTNHRVIAYQRRKKVKEHVSKCICDAKHGDITEVSNGRYIVLGETINKNHSNESRTINSNLLYVMTNDGALIEFADENEIYEMFLKIENLL